MKSSSSTERGSVSLATAKSSRPGLFNGWLLYKYSCGVKYHKLRQAVNSKGDMKVRAIQWRGNQCNSSRVALLFLFAEERFRPRGDASPAGLGHKQSFRKLHKLTVLREIRFVQVFFTSSFWNRTSLQKYPLIKPIMTPKCQKCWMRRSKFGYSMQIYKFSLRGSAH